MAFGAMIAATANTGFIRPAGSDFADGCARGEMLIAFLPAFLSALAGDLALALALWLMASVNVMED